MKIKNLLETYSSKNQETINIKGWIRNNRVGKNVSFLTINDGTCFETVQIVYKNLTNQEEIIKTHIGSAIDVIGTLKILENKQQSFEIVADSITIIARSKENYPVQPKKHTFEFLREIAHLRPRTNTFNAVFKIRSLLSYAVHSYFNENDFVHVHTPIITSTDAEGAGEMFQVTTMDLEKSNTDFKKDFFNKSVNLTVSGQLLAESYAMAYSNVYTFGPTFRAENSNTTRHAAEFWMIEPEMAFVELEENIKIAQELLIYVVKYVLKKGISELTFLNSLVEYDLIQRLEDLLSANFITIDYKEAIEILKNSNEKFQNKVEFGIDLATEHEKFLTDKHFKVPVFVKNYPKDIKAFYMKLNDDKQTVAAMDLLVPGIGELIGGSQREIRIDILEDRMKEHNLSLEEYKWYLELRKYGGVEHSGFGIGFERLIMYVTGMENIRDVISFPRTVKNCDY